MAKLACPHCGISLGWRLLRGKPLPGERKILPNRAVLVCPSCQGELHPNPHPAEFWVYVAFLPLVVLFHLLALQIIPTVGDSQLWLGAMLGSLLLATLVTIYVHFKFLRNWPRFATKPSPPKFPFNFRRH